MTSIFTRLTLIFEPRRYIRSFIFISTNQLRCAMSNQSNSQWCRVKAIKSHTKAARYKIVYLFDVKLDLWTRQKSLFSAPTAHPEREKSGNSVKNQYSWHCCRHHMHINMIMCRPWQWLHRPWLSTLLSSKIHRYQKS